MVGRHLPPHQSISQLTLPHDSVLSKCRRSRHTEFQPHHGRHLNETVALHARYHLAITPPLPQSQQRAACALGLERFEEFTAQVGRRVHLNTPLMRETMERLSTTSSDPCARDIKEGAPLGAAAADSKQDVAASTVTDLEEESSAAAREDGSNGGFLEEGPNPLR